MPLVLIDFRRTETRNINTFTRNMYDFIIPLDVITCVLWSKMNLKIEINFRTSCCFFLHGLRKKLSGRQIRLVASGGTPAPFYERARCATLAFGTVCVVYTELYIYIEARLRNPWRICSL